MYIHTYIHTYMYILCVCVCVCVCVCIVYEAERQGQLCHGPYVHRYEDTYITVSGHIYSAITVV